jgi:hypothetical protein
MQKQKQKKKKKQKFKKHIFVSEMILFNIYLIFN